jgi:YHS domain-containing protein
MRFMYFNPDVKLNKKECMLMKNKVLALLLAFSLGLAFISTAVMAQDQPSVKKDTCAMKADQGCCQGAICPVSGKPANKEIFTEYKGQKVYFCCNDCKAAFEKDPAKYEAKIFKPTDACQKDSTISCPKAAGKKCDKASGCCKSDEKMGDKAKGCKEIMVCPISGKPANPEIFSEFKGQKVFFCCKDAKKAFDKDPTKYEAKIHKCAEACKKECKDPCKKEEKPAEK